MFSDILFYGRKAFAALAGGSLALAAFLAALEIFRNLAEIIHNLYPIQ